MLHPDTALVTISPSVGLGVVATRPISRGTVVWIRDPFDRVLTDADLDEMEPVLRRQVEPYVYTRTDGTYLLCWDSTRFMNHSCEPNVMITSFDAEIAVRDIAVGEQLTNDYATMCITDDEPFECSCGARHCRRRITPLDALVLNERWDALIAEALRRVPSVPQPLPVATIGLPPSPGHAPDESEYTAARAGAVSVA